MKPLCIYHSNCADGFASAWVVRKALGAEVEFYPGIHSESPPNVTDRDIILVDFSYSRAVFLDMAAIANSILVLDHHKSAATELVNLPANVTCVFNMGRSGATVTWKHFFPTIVPPALLLHIEDYDLWALALPKTREIIAALFSYPYEFAVWDKLMCMPLLTLEKEGVAIERKQHKDVAALVKICQRNAIIGGFCVPIASLPYTLADDAGRLMARGHSFAACYWDTPTTRQFGLRSLEGGEDVSVVAAKYGGGGHKHSAGFGVPLSSINQFELPSTIRKAKPSGTVKPSSTVTQSSSVGSYPWGEHS